MENIHSATIDVLEKTGCQILDKPCLFALKDAGCEVNEDKHLVKVPEGLVTDSLKKCSRKLTLYGRYPKYDVTLGTGKVYGHPSEGSVRVLDLETNEPRPAAIKDVEPFTRLVDGLNNVDLCFSPIVPQDLPSEIVGLHVAKILLQNTVKPCCPGGLGLGIRKYIRKMIAAVLGSEEEMKKRPIGAMTQGSLFPVSPLKFPKEQLIEFREAATLSFPCSTGSMPQAGATAPVTLAGTLVIQTAEILTGLVLGQVLQPGIPMFVFIRAAIMDIRIGSFSSGAPEFALVEAAATQLFHEFYKLPVNGGWGVSDSKILDEQVGYEKSFTWLLSVLAGASAVSGMGALESGLAASPTQLVIDNEILGMIRRVNEGIMVDDERLAVDLINEVGIGGHYVSKMHTLQLYKSEQYMPKISYRYPREVWERDGAKNIIKRAQENAQSLLDTHEIEPLPNDVIKELNLIVKDAEKELV